MRREAQTVKAMIRVYCAAHHLPAGDGLCGACRELLDYAQMRLERCPFQDDKTTCAKCAVHCYRPAMRERIRTVMRYAGPRMLGRHPLLTFYHWVDSRRRKPRVRRKLRT